MRKIILAILILLITYQLSDAQDTMLRYSVQKTATVSGLPATVATTIPAPASETAKMLDLAKQAGKSKIAFKVLKYLPIVGTAIYIAWDVYDLITTVEQGLPPGNRKTGSIWTKNVNGCSVSLTTQSQGNQWQGSAPKEVKLKVRNDCKVEFADEVACYEQSHIHMQQEFNVPKYVVTSSYNTETFSRYCNETFYITSIYYDNQLWQTQTLNDLMESSWSVQNVTNYITNNYETVNNYMNNADKQSVTLSDTLPSNAVEVTIQTAPTAVKNINNNTNITYSPVTNSQGKAVDVITGIEYQKTMTTTQSEQTTTITAPNVPSEPKFDTDIEIPEKKDIKTKLRDFVSNHPFLNTIKNVKINAEAGECSFTTTLFGSELHINFCQYESTFGTIGNVILAFATLYGCLIIFKV